MKKASVYGYPFTVLSHRASAVLLFALTFWSVQIFGQPASDDLQAKLNAIKTMKAAFQQVVKAKKRQVSSSSGTMALRRPGQFRWNTKEPMPQLVVADGKKLWVYDVDLEQVTVRQQDEGMGGTAALFLSGYDNTVARDFNVTQTRKGGKNYFDLRSKSKKANFQRVQLIFEGQKLTEMQLFDQLGQQTFVRLSRIQMNPQLPKQLFQFKMPKDVDVIEQ